MSDFLQLILTLVIILSAAKVAGYLSTKFGQPSVFGELLVGIILGPSLINLVNLPFISDNHIIDIIDDLGEIGVLLLMFLAGIELHLSDLAKSSRVAMFSGTLGVILPVVLGFVAGKLFGMEQQTALFLGLTLAATSVSISAQTLMELGYLRTPPSALVYSGSVYDEFWLSSLLTVLFGQHGWGLNTANVLLLIGRMILFFVLNRCIWLLPAFESSPAHRKIIHQFRGLITFSPLFCFSSMGWQPNSWNMAAITGTFFAGLFYSRTLEKEKISEGIQSLCMVSCPPCFFVSIGLKTNLAGFSINSLGFLLFLTLVAILSKILGSGWGAGLGVSLGWNHINSAPGWYHVVK